MFTAPHGLDEVVRTYGDVRLFIRRDGTLDPQWEKDYIIRIPLPMPLRYDTTQVTRITSHKVAAPLMEATLTDIYSAGLWPKLREYGGGFEFRKKRGMNAVSLHSWGIAWDFDPSNNQLGTKGTMDKGIVDIFEFHGFTWGGGFAHRPDPMHFQLASGI